MKYYLLFAASFFCAAFNQALAQNPSTDIMMGKAYQIPSKFLGEELTIQISVPKSYSDSEDRFPTLYILDGQWFFPHALSIRSDFNHRNGAMVIPEFIIVSITTDNAKRGKWAMRESALFLDFIEKELFPFVEHNYRTSKDRLLFGWEATGGLVVKTLALKPELFSAYLAASPAPLYGSYFPYLENEHLAFEQFLKSSKNFDKFLFIGQGEGDFPVQYGTTALTALLTKSAPKELRWKHQIMAGVSHQLCAYNTMQLGLRAYYQLHSKLTFNSKAEFMNMGGLAYMDRFYQQRSAELPPSEDTKLKHSTRRNLTLLAISEDDYEWFGSLMTTFEKDSLIEKSFPPHLNDYAQYYLKHGNTDKAAEVISFLRKEYPNKAQGLNSLGDLYFALRNTKEAIIQYQKAVKLGTEKNDKRLPEYKADLIKCTN